MRAKMRPQTNVFVLFVHRGGKHQMTKSQSRSIMLLSPHTERLQNAKCFFHVCRQYCLRCLKMDSWWHRFRICNRSVWIDLYGITVSRLWQRMNVCGPTLRCLSDVNWMHHGDSVTTLFASHPSTSIYIHWATCFPLVKWKDVFAYAWRKGNVEWWRIFFSHWFP